MSERAAATASPLFYVLLLGARSVACGTTRSRMRRGRSSNEAVIAGAERFKQKDEAGRLAAEPPRRRAGAVRARAKYMMTVATTRPPNPQHAQISRRSRHRHARVPSERRRSVEQRRAASAPSSVGWIACPITAMADAPPASLCSLDCELEWSCRGELTKKRDPSSTRILLLKMQ